MIRILSVAALLAVGATIAYAQGAGGAAAIADRKAAMKAGGATWKPPSPCTGSMTIAAISVGAASQ